MSLRSFTHVLSDGTSLLIREIDSRDRARLEEGLDLLSSESRYRRFFAPVTRLSDEQLDYLTDVDQVRHVAWGALSADDPTFPGYGIGRFIRMDRDPRVAEVAVTVIDSFHGHGVGTVLFATLYQRARVLGVRLFHAFFLPENRYLAHLLRALGGTIRHEEHEYHVTLPIHPGNEAFASTEGAAQFAKLLDEVSGKLSEVA